MKTGRLLTIVMLMTATGIVRAQSWTPKASQPIGRMHAVGFSIGNKGYIGTGTDNNANLKDLWEWDKASNVWTQKANFGGTARNSAVGFSVGAKGYIGTGLDDNGMYRADLWEYDPTTNKWTQRADFPDTRVLAVAFSIGSKGYIGTGRNSQAFQKDLWEWDQGSNAWTKKADLPGVAREGAVAYSIGTKGYIGTGNYQNMLQQDYWEWDQISNTWTQRANFGGGVRQLAVGFSIGTKGYIGTGAGKTNTPEKDFWQWNQSTDTWVQKPDYSGGPVRDAVGFAIGTEGYIGTGSPNSMKTLPQNYFAEYKDSTCTLAANISSDPGTTVCSGQSVYISAWGGSSYAWSTGASGPNIVVHPNVTTAYTVTITNASGCSGTTAITVPVDTTCSVTGMNQHDASTNNSSIVPTPFNRAAKLIITGSDSDLSHELIVFGVLGNEVKRVAFSGSELEIDGLELQEGTYIYQLISDGKNSSTGRFIKSGQ